MRPDVPPRRPAPAPRWRLTAGDGGAARSGGSAPAGCEPAGAWAAGAGLPDAGPASAATAPPAACRRPAGGRESTASARLRAVERVVVALHERFAEPLSLDAMARIAISSPFHLNRVFRELTGLPPGRFLAAVRLQAAKRLLVRTQLSVTEICFAVGYNSLGAFTTCFTQFVGLSPNRLRRLCRELGGAPLPWGDADPVALSPGIPPARQPRAGAGTIEGRLRATPGFVGLAMVGLFRAPVPRGRPVACTLADVPGAFRLDDVAAGRYHVLAVGVAPSADPLALAVGDAPRRAAAGPLWVGDGTTTGSPEIVLREPRLTDPPILVALPALMLERAAYDPGPVRR